MADRVRDVMTTNPRTVEANETIVEAARQMRDEDIGAVVVLRGSRVAGIVTDRDIVVRAVADGRFPGGATIGEIATQEIVTVGPDDALDQALELMRSRAVRRLPMVEHEKAIGILSIGDIAVTDDASPVLADISAAAPNN